MSFYSCECVSILISACAIQPRIRIAKALLVYDASEQTILEFLPEAVFCCKEVNNARCRTNAFELITQMATSMAENHGDEGVAKFLDAISSGLVDSPSAIAASILALTCTVHLYQGTNIYDRAYFGGMHASQNWLILAF